MSDSNCSNCLNITNTNITWDDIEDCDCDKCIEFISNILDNLPDIPRLNVKVESTNVDDTKVSNDDSSKYLEEVNYQQKYRNFYNNILNIKKNNKKKYYKNEKIYYVNRELINNIYLQNKYSYMGGLYRNLQKFSSVNFVNTTNDFKNILFKSFLGKLGINNVNNQDIYNELFKCLLGTIHFGATNKTIIGLFQWSTYNDNGYFIASSDIVTRKRAIENVIYEINNTHSLITYVRIIRFLKEIQKSNQKSNNLNEYIEHINNFLKLEITNDETRVNFINAVSSSNQLYKVFNYLHQNKDKLSINYIINFISESNTPVDNYHSNNLNKSNNKSNNIIPNINNNTSFPTLGNETNDINANNTNTKTETYSNKVRTSTKPDQKKKNKSKPQKQTSTNSSTDLNSTNTDTTNTKTETYSNIVRFSIKPNQKNKNKSKPQQQTSINSSNDLTSVSK
jgi:hypothetical protein